MINIMQYFIFNCMYYFILRLRCAVFPFINFHEISIKINASLMQSYSVASDEDTWKIKGPTVMTEKERAESVRHCKYVDEVIENSPWVLTPEFVEKHKVRYQRTLHVRVYYSRPFICIYIVLKHFTMTHCGTADRSTLSCTART